MSSDLNSITLSPAVAASLYRTSLINSEAGDVPIKDLPVIKKVKDEWKFLGENSKNILIVVNHKSTTHLPDEELSLLTTILVACKLDLGNVAIVNTNNYPTHTYKEYLGYFNSQIVMLFGLDPAGFGLPIDFPHFQVQSFSKTKFLYSPPLGEYDQLLKRKLWDSLKLIFGI